MFVLFFQFTSELSNGRYRALVPVQILCASRGTMSLGLRTIGCRQWTLAPGPGFTPMSPHPPAASRTTQRSWAGTTRWRRFAGPSECGSRPHPWSSRRYPTRTSGCGGRRRLTSWYSLPLASMATAHPLMARAAFWPTPISLALVWAGTPISTQMSPGPSPALT